VGLVPRAGYCQMLEIGKAGGHPSKRHCASPSSAISLDAIAPAGVEAIEAGLADSRPLQATAQHSLWVGSDPSVIRVLQPVLGQVNRSVEQGLAGLAWLPAV